MLYHSLPNNAIISLQVTKIQGLVLYRFISRGRIILKEKRCCANCIKGTSMTVNDDILCREKGAVSPDYVCSRHRYSPAIKVLEEKPKCIQCQYFIYDIHHKDCNTIGLCSLFSVRKFDGASKKACSKFTKAKKQEVS